MASQPIALVLGAGPRIGISVAERFASDGFKVAMASRKGTGSINSKGILSLKADFSKPNSIDALFTIVKAELGAAPSVIVYNAATMTPPPIANSALSIPVESVTADLYVNTISPYAAAQQAVSGWETLPKEVKKTFIYTGNASNLQVVPMAIMLTLGVGKSASAYWIGVADMTYSTQGYRFFYADERKEDGARGGMEIDGPAHADFYVQLANHEKGVPWEATFVKNKGYVKFW
ncbi:hypothetical protein MMC25_007357 [Agyrium rufum]|nr:hypothetical protein [Agyrium rufum]